MDAAKDKKKKTLHTMGYVTQDFIKYEEAQKTIENARQTTQWSEVTSKTNNELKSHLTDNKSLPYNTVDDRAETLSMEESNMPNSNLIEMRKISSKRKHKKSTMQAKKVLPRGKKKKKLNKTSLDLKPIGLCLVTHNDKKAHVDCEAVKKISKKSWYLLLHCLRRVRSFKLCKKLITLRKLWSFVPLKQEP